MHVLTWLYYFVLFVDWRINIVKKKRKHLQHPVIGGRDLIPMSSSMIITFKVYVMNF
jgi:hypothetical protein